MYREELLPG